MQDAKSTIKYLQGLADGLEIEEKSAEGKILVQMLDAMNDLADRVEKLEKDQGKVEKLIEDAIAEQMKDLGHNILAHFFESLMEYVAGEGELPFEVDSEDDFLLNYLYGEDDDEDDDDDDDDDDEIDFSDLFDFDFDEDEDEYEVECQSCGTVYTATFDDFEANEVVCPRCHSQFVIPEDILEKLAGEKNE